MQAYSRLKITRKSLLFCNARKLPKIDSEFWQTSIVIFMEHRILFHCKLQSHKPFKPNEQHCQNREREGEENTVVSMLVV